MPSCETSTPLYSPLALKVKVDLYNDLSHKERWIHLSFHSTNCSLDKINDDSMSNELLDSTDCSRREADSGDKIEIAFAKIEGVDQRSSRTEVLHRFQSFDKANWNISLLNDCLPVRRHRKEMGHFEDVCEILLLPEQLDAMDVRNDNDAVVFVVDADRKPCLSLGSRRVRSTDRAFEIRFANRIYVAWR